LNNENEDINDGGTEEDVQVDCFQAKILIIMETEEEKDGYIETINAFSCCLPHFTANLLDYLEETLQSTEDIEFSYEIQSIVKIEGEFVDLSIYNDSDDDGSGNSDDGDTPDGNDGLSIDEHGNNKNLDVFEKFLSKMKNDGKYLQ
jgi:hypothetical protein